MATLTPAVGAIKKVSRLNTVLWPKCAQGCHKQKQMTEIFSSPGNEPVTLQRVEVAFGSFPVMQ